MGNLTLRHAQGFDGPAIAGLVNSVYRGDPRAQGWTSEAHLIQGDRITSQQVEAIIADPRQVILIAERDSLLVGCVHLKRESHYAYLGMLSVAATTQDAGIGSRLIRASEEFVRTAWNLSTIQMWVLTVRTELIAWYERKGYTTTLERIPYAAIGPEAGRPLAEGLEFAVLRKDLNPPQPPLAAR